MLDDTAMQRYLSLVGLLGVLVSGVSCTAEHVEEDESADLEEGEEIGKSEDSLGISFRLPFPANTSYKISQGPHGSFSHVPPYNQHAVDFAMPHGHRVVASAAGRVVYSGWFANEIRVIIDHGGNTCSLYTHLSRTVVGAGAYVLSGHDIGRSGSTGATAPHLHWGLINCNGWTSKTIASTYEMGRNYPVGAWARSLNWYTR